MPTPESIETLDGEVITLSSTHVYDRASFRLPRAQHTPSRWRQEAVGQLVDGAVSELCSGTNPRRSIRALVGFADQQGGGDVTAVLERRLDEALAAWVEQRRRAMTGAPEVDLQGVVRALLAPLFAHLPVAALEGYPHPGSWPTVSVDERSCVVHGYESDAVDCLRMRVESYLVDTVERAVARADSRPAPLPTGEEARAGLWLGVAVLAAWRARGAVTCTGERAATS